MDKKIFGVGVNDLKYKENKEISKTKAYKIWLGILRRSYDKKYKEKFKTYACCKVCDEWLLFSNFKKWFDENYRFDLGNQGVKLELDKDLLGKDEKLHSPENCVFLPYDVNTFIRKRNSNNTSGFVGVTWDKEYEKWRVRTNGFETKKNISCGRFDNFEEACQVYKCFLLIEVEKVKVYLTKLGYNQKVIQELEDKFKKEGL